MTAEVLLQELRSRGVRLIPEGDRIRYRAPMGALTPDLKAKLSARKVEVLAALQGERLQPIPSAPADQLAADWHRAIANSRKRFETTGVEPDQTTLEAAAWVQLQLEQGLFPRPGISESAARRLLEAVYAGRLVARVDDGARVVLREPAKTAVPG